MSGYVKCLACPRSEQCDEEGQCLNTWVTRQTGYVLRFAKPPVAGSVVNVPPLATCAPVPRAQLNGEWIAPTKPAKAPPSAPRAPGGGTVTDQIFAACNAALAELGEGATLEAARKVAIPRLEAAGVNINSARKGSSMWIASRR